MITPKVAVNTAGDVQGMRVGGLALADRWGAAYDEAAFRYVLVVERKRAERSSQPLLLLLVDVKERSAHSASIDRGLADQLLSGLLCLRECDIVGWYHEGCVAGAVLAEFGNRPWTVARRVSQRVSDVLSARVSPAVARRLRVRLYQDLVTENIEPAAPTYEGAVGPRRT